ncbi:DUF3499 domain-containing protein [Raineyella sp. W15-4]|uniref:DUF3499 domain-containing protein n=1 Tax=Raineyella sp. W15-4 TaxID=3081651 RepID=UPI0029558B4E|nr:DUF3499 domain-containing protein [Raineyella sp. W15-4]WOQ17991.1 DUF3499 domain-containing protein [Raineyella sp. W15-4]
MTTRRCTRSGCGRSAVATLTFAYADQQVVLGPLSARSEPAAYDLCLEHSQRLSVPRGWDVIRLPLTGRPEQPDADDLMALADAIRRVGLAEDEPVGPGDFAERADVREVAHKGHLTMLKDSGGTEGGRTARTRGSRPS